MDRRNFIKTLILGCAATKLFPVVDAFAQAATSCCIYPGPSGVIKINPSTNAPEILSSPVNTYATYPHANGFLPDGRLVIATGPSSNPSATATQYFAFNLQDGTTSPLMTISDARMYYAVSLDTGIMAVPTVKGNSGGITVVNLMTGETLLDWVDTPPNLPNGKGTIIRYSQDIDISKEGTRVLATRVIYNSDGSVYSSSFLIYNLAKGEFHTIFDSPLDRAGNTFALDHAHFSPYNQEWVFFCNNTPGTNQRMWVWHWKHAPNGMPLFDQSYARSPLFLTHERALFDELGVIVPAVAAGEGSPRGLYKVSLIDENSGGIIFGGRATLVSESNEDFHCNAQQAHPGWYVVSLQGAAGKIAGPNGQTMYDLSNLAPNEPDWLTSAKGYSESDVFLVHAGSGKRIFLYAGTEANIQQPYEVQPAFCPFGEWVILKNGSARNVLAIKLDTPEIEKIFAT